VTGRPEWQRPVAKDRSEVLAWLGAGMSDAEWREYELERALRDARLGPIGGGTAVTLPLPLRLHGPRGGGGVAGRVDHVHRHRHLEPFAGLEPGLHSA
jgi:hypothetical protein